MKKATRAVFYAALSLAAAGCSRETSEPRSEAEPARTVEVINISGVPLAMSDSSEVYSIEHKTGVLEVGASAVALCIDYTENSPKSTQVLVEQAGEIGFVGVYSAVGKTGEPKQQLNPGLEELQSALSDCKTVST